MELFLHPLHHLTCGILQYEDSVINPGLNAQVDWEALMPHQWWGKEKEDALTKSTQGWGQWLAAAAACICLMWDKSCPLVKTREV